MRILLAAMLLGQPGASQCGDEARQEAISAAGRVVRECIRAEAPSLAGSRDRAADVATAIMVRCQSNFDDVLAAVATCSPSSAERLRPRLSHKFHAIAVEEVVSLRARR